MGSEYQALTVHSKKGRRENNHHQGKHSHQKNNFMRRDPSRLRCYTCNEIGHFAKKFPKNKNGSKKKKMSKRRHHAHTAEDDDPPVESTIGPFLTIFNHLFFPCFTLLSILIRPVFLTLCLKLPR